jgi:hypothetical protein
MKIRISSVDFVKNVISFVVFVIQIIFKRCRHRQGRKSGAKAGGAQGGVNLFFYFGDQKETKFSKAGGA